MSTQRCNGSSLDLNRLPVEVRSVKSISQKNTNSRWSYSVYCNGVKCPPLNSNLFILFHSTGFWCLDPHSFELRLFQVSIHGESKYKERVWYEVAGDVKGSRV